MNSSVVARFFRIFALRATAGFGLALILLPIVLVVWLAFFKQEIPSFPPDGYTLHWFGVAAGESKFIQGFSLSLRVALAATALGLLISVPAAVALNRFVFRGRLVVNNLLVLPMIVPGIVLGTALYIFEVNIELAADVPAIGSLWGLVMSHTLLVVPWCIRLLSASLTGLDRGIEDAAMNLGASPITTFFRITLPNIRPGVVAASLFGFVVSFGNLEVTLFLVGPGQTTLPIAILQYLQWKIDPAIAAASVVQIVFICAALVVTDRYVKLSRVV